MFLLVFRDIFKCLDIELVGGGYFLRGNFLDKCMFRFNFLLLLLMFWLCIIFIFLLIGYCICFFYLGMLVDFLGCLFEWYVF